MTRLAILLLVLAAAKADLMASFHADNDLTRGLIRINIARVNNDRVVLAAGINVILQLGAEQLKLERSVSTGPRLDSPECHASGCTHAASKQMSDDLNQILVVDEDKMISCGTLFQGACFKYDLTDLSLEPEFLAEAVAADKFSLDAILPNTLGIIGFQRYHRWGQGKVLYVGSTFTGTNDFRHDVPALSARNLHDLRFAEFSFSQQSLLKIDRKFRDHFLVHYVHAFNTSDHVYFALVQRRSHVPGAAHQGFVSRLARFCNTDSNFDTYVEITLHCKDNYDIMTSGSFSHDRFVASFAKSADNSDPNNIHKDSSALCSFDLADIERSFENNIRTCLNGTTDRRDMDYISGPILEGKCFQANGNYYHENNLCDIGLKISGKQPLKGQLQLQMENDLITSLLKYDDEDGSRDGVFVGLESGRILYSNLNTNEEEEDFNQPSLVYTPKSDESGRIRQMEWLDSSTLVLMTSRMVGKLRLADCESHDSCDSCLSSTLPFCGWCSESATCSLRHSCRSDWSSGKGKCARVTQVRPKVLSYDDPSTEVIKLRIQPMPKFADLLCNFSSGRIFETAAVAIEDNWVACPNPLLLNSGFKERELNISIVFAATSQSLVTTSVAIVGCDQQDTCQSCSRASHCVWCASSLRCVPKKSVMAMQCSSKPGSCVQLRPLTPRVPHDTAFSVRLLASNSASVFSATQKQPLLCLMSVEGAKLKVSASLRRRDSDRVVITCDSTRYKYHAEESVMNASLSLVTQDERVIAGPAAITLYKCNLMANECRECNALQPRFDCRYCSNRCETSAKCLETSDVIACPGPQIVDLWPKSGPSSGGTRLSIKGRDLGLDNRFLPQVTIGNDLCEVVDTTPPSIVVCITPKSYAHNASLVVRTTAGVTEESVFQYIDNVVIHSATPNKGPRAGGTRLRITGDRLNTGTKVEVKLDGQIPCIVEGERTRHHLTCVTSRVAFARFTHNLSVIIDGAEMGTITFKFEFVDNPFVVSVRPRSSFMAGGRTIVVHGQNFAALHNVQLLVHLSATKSANNTCQIISDTLMECLSPPIDSNLVEMEDNIFPLGLKAADVKSLLHLANVDMRYVPNPVVYDFPNRPIKIFENEAFVIEGKGLDAAAEVDEVRVTLGNDHCNVTSITSTQLLCMPPRDATSNGKDPEVVVYFGPSLSYKLGVVKYGSLHYSSLASNNFFFSSETIGAISALVVLVVFLTCSLVLIALRHKSSAVEREYKRIQMQMNVLENSIRSECKRSFAELQTCENTLRHKTNQRGSPLKEPPLQSYEHYLQRIFFPNHQTHPSFPDDYQELDYCGEKTDKAELLQLKSLLSEPQFLHQFVSMMEQENSMFSDDDKMNFASLLSVVLSTRMSLFADLVRLFVMNNMGGSNKSIVGRKLTANWLAICLHDYIMDSHVALSLLQLHKAIKTQVEGGPVDVVTGRAKFSLSHQRLLRHDECDDYMEIKCSVLIITDEDEDNCFVVNRVLDCDTVSQAKSKMIEQVFAHLPFSQLPSVHVFDLKWQRGKDDLIVLRDFDDRNLNSGHVNTLKHYNISAEALFQLSPAVSNNNAHAPLWHLSKIDSNTNRRGIDNGVALPEVYLTRMLSTKCVIKSYLDDSLYSLLSVQHKFPCSLKWFLDLGESNQTRSQLLVADFYLDCLIQNLDCVLDVSMDESVVANLDVFANVVRDACVHTSGQEVRLTKELPVHQLLFAKEIADYARVLSNFYEDVEQLPQLADLDFHCHMSQLSRKNEMANVDQTAAIRELKRFVDICFN